jgi:hypothetical protein
MNERLINQVSFDVALDVVRVFAPLLREEEQRREAVSEVFEKIKAGIGWYCLETDRIRERLHPTRN